MAQKNAIEFVIDLSEANAHLFNVEMKLTAAARHQRFSLPTWTPGSYMVREHAQHIVTIKAFSSDDEVVIEKVTKNVFVARNETPVLMLRYQVYGFDPSIRAAYIDNRQAFFNGTSLFLRPQGVDEGQYVVNLLAPQREEQKHWRVATGMPKLDCDARGFGKYIADDYLALIDYPAQIGEFTSLGFQAGDIPHEMVLVDDIREFDVERLKNDLAKVCEQHIQFFDKKAPFTKYLFIARFLENSHGGLEHRNSSMLLSSPYSLPKKDDEQASESYRNFLGLCSHEYFHAWNVKSLKPKSFAPYDLDHECYTTMLWVFEGITSYYDDLLLKRASVISQESYLELLSKSISRLLSTKGRHLQSLSQASFDAWIKFYRPNENSSNATVSYYLKGSLVAMFIDLTLRKISGGQASLDDCMRMAMEKFGQDRGITEEQFFACLRDVGYGEIDDLKNKYIYGVEELPLAEVVDHFGLEMVFKPDEKFIDDKTKMQAFLGIKLHLENKQRAIISFVEKSSPGMNAGLSVKDEIIAFNNIRLDGDNYTNLLSSIRPGEKLDILYVRNKQVRSCKLVPENNPQHHCAIRMKANISADEKKRLDNWLGHANRHSTKGFSSKPNNLSLSIF